MQEAGDLGRPWPDTLKTAFPYLQAAASAEQGEQRPSFLQHSCSSCQVASLVPEIYDVSASVLIIGYPLPLFSEHLGQL